MKYHGLALSAVFVALVACGSSHNTLNNDNDDDDGGESVSELPGTTDPSPNRSITRYEPRDNSGSGYVTDIDYDADDDTFTIDNLAFDGDNVYERGTAVGSIGPFAVYEGKNTYPADVTGTPISQGQHRALHGVSESGDVEFTIVRTGAYTNYGFGGFVYQRNGDVTLPNSGQALFSGDYGAIRDFEGRGGIEYASGTMDVAIDFGDFNEGAAIRGVVYDRRILNTNGQDITQSVLNALNAEHGTGYSQLPTLRFDVGPGVMDRNGEATGTLQSNIATTSGLEVLESGNYYAIISGDDASEIVGVIVVESDDARFENVTVRETGGFILERN